MADVEKTAERKAVMRLENVVPWGRSFEEYCRMFNLTEQELSLSILGCADGPASFNAELHAKGGRVISVDPVYQFSREEIAERISETYPKVKEEVEKNLDDFIWDEFADVETLGLARMSAMNVFLGDYDNGIKEGRYIGASLPFLPFEPKQFQLALCSHYLFLYSNMLDETAHLKAVTELCRVAEEVRIYPLVDLSASLSPHLLPVMDAMANYGIDCRLEKVAYQFQKNAGHMLVCHKR